MIYTIGHSTRTFEEFLDLLKTHGADRVVDVRTVPGSKRVPQFNRESITKRLAGAGLGYTHMKGLGGWRKPHKDSPNTAWRNESFRGFADYLQTEEFEENLSRLIALSQDQTIALMCAEAVPWRCHRSLIADALTARGLEVRHITGPGEPKPHEMTSFAKVEGTKVTYPGDG